MKQCMCSMYIGMCMIPVPLACLFFFLTMRMAGLRRRFVVELKPFVLFSDSRGYHVHTYFNGNLLGEGRTIIHTALLGNETPTVLGIPFTDSPRV